MSGTPNKIAIFYFLRPAQFNFLQRLEWLASPSICASSSKLKMRLKHRSADEELVLACEGVRNFRLSSVGIVQPVLQVQDISGNQWDRSNYEFRDIENDAIYFLCQDFSAAIEKYTDE